MKKSTELFPCPSKKEKSQDERIFLFPLSPSKLDHMNSGHRLDLDEGDCISIETHAVMRSINDNYSISKW